MGVLHSFSIKNIFYDKMDLRLFFMWRSAVWLLHDQLWVIVESTVF